MGESAEELKLKMQTAESILNDATAINHISGTQNGFGSVENNVDSGGDHDPNGNSNHNASSHKYKEENSSSSSKPKDGSSSSSKHKDHHSSSSSSKHKEGHKSSSSSSKHKDGHSSSSSKPKDGSSSSSSKPKDGSSSTPSKSSSDKQKDSHSKDKHHSSSDKKHSSSEHKSHSKSSSSDKHRDGTSKSSSDKPKDGSSKSSSSGEKHRDGSSKSSSSADKHSSKSSSSDKHRDSSSKSSSDKHKDSSKSSSSDKHKDGSGKSSSSSDKHKDSSSRPASDKHKDGSKSLSDKHKDGSSRSSSDKHKDGGSKSSSDKHRDGSSKTSSSSDKHRDGSKSSSSDKHKDANKSPDKHKDRSKESSSSDKHKDRARDVSSSMSPDKCSSSPDKYSSSPEKHSGSDHHRESSKLAENGADFVNESVTRRISLEGEMKPVSIKLEKIEMNREEMHVEHVKKDPSSDEDEVPLSARIKMETAPGKRRYEESSDDEPLSARMQKVKKVKKEVKEEDDDFKPSKKRKTEEEEEFVPVKKKKIKNKVKEVKVESKSVMKAKKKAQEEQQVWKWWEEEKRDDGIKWTFLEHKGPVFAPLYDRLPKKVKFHYNGKEMQLSEATEEVAGFYAKMLDHDYTGKEVFNNNFFKDWRKVMSKEEKEIITDLSKCNFKELNTFFLQQSEERKNRTKEQKQELKKQNEEITKEYGFCTIDGHTEKIGNFRIEPPGLFRGRGDHPKQGRLKKRVEAEEVIINCSKNSKIPTAPEGHKWKEVRHDNSVTWLASWTENIQGATKYVMLNAASKLKGEKDWQKYEIARKLHKCVDKIRATYREDWKSKEMRVRQRAVALYFIDKLALRAGNEKEEGETADTVGCCSLRVEHIHLFAEKEGKECVVEFDFLGKDSIRYQNSVPVEKRVFKNLQLFVENKQQDDDLFDRLNTTLMNKHLHDLMEGLTAKVFRTYNASRTLQEQLDLLTNEEDPIAAKLLSYNRANRAVAILCNHQRSAPKTFAQSMENLMNKVEDKRKQVKDAKKDIKDAKSDYKNHNTERNRAIVDKKKNSLKRLEEQLTKLEVQATDKEENKEIALGTSKLNYLDPRISVAWCKKWDVPIEKVYNKTQRDKFRWAIDMATDDFKF